MSDKPIPAPTEEPTSRDESQLEKEPELVESGCQFTPPESTACAAMTEAPGTPTPSTDTPSAELASTEGSSTEAAGTEAASLDAASAFAARTDFPASVVGSTTSETTEHQNARITPQKAEGMDEKAWEEVADRYQKATSAWDSPTEVQRTLTQFSQRLANNDLRLMFDEDRKDQQNQCDVTKKAFAVQEPLKEGEIWFLGDLHADLLALESVLVYLERRYAHQGCDNHKPKVSLVFLGDLFDDGKYGAETMLRVMRLILDESYSVCVIAGNHDEALGYSEKTQTFYSTVSPCEFSEWLNDAVQTADPLAKQLGKLTIDFFSRCPRALFFSNGLLAAHAGVPLSDRFDKLTRLEELNDEICLQDFAWTRPHHRRKRTRPNRTRKGAEFGHEDFSDFCECVGKLDGVTVERMIRGHDHVDTVERFVSFDAYEGDRMLTINTLCYRLDRETVGEFVRAPCIARYGFGKLPEIIRLDVPEKLVREYYGEQKPTD